MPKLLDQLREALRSRHYSRRTEQTYCHWVRRYIHFHNVRHPAEMAEPETNAFLTYLAVKEKVSASTQNQALSALLFLYRHVIGREVGDLDDGWGRVLLPDALDREYPNAPKEWRWQWVFPQENQWKNAKTGEVERHHVHESIIQKTGLAKRATRHTFRHSFATQLLESGYNIGTVQEFQGREDHYDLHPCTQKTARHCRGGQTRCRRTTW
jgi:site-specific recombinase XerD